jgi:hypothetical protein
MIIFLEEGDFSFNPTHISELGTVPQTWAIVQPVGDQWRVGFLANPNLKAHSPCSPSFLVDLPTLKEIMLTKRKSFTIYLI